MLHALESASGKSLTFLGLFEVSARIRQFDVVRVKAIRDNRFADATICYERCGQLRPTLGFLNGRYT